MKKKICFLFPYNTWGGAFRSTYELANRVVATDDYSVDIVFPIFAPQITAAVSGRLRKFTLWSRSLLRALYRWNRVPWFRVKCNVRVIPFITEKYLGEYDIVIGNHWHTLRPLHNLKVNGKKITYVRDVEFFELYHQQQLNDFALPVTKICVADWIRKFLNDQGLSADYVLPNGTNIAPFTNSRDRSQSAGIVTVGMCYATLTPKDMPGGIEVLKRIKEHHREVEIVLFGFPPDPMLDFDYEYVRRPTGERLRAVYERIDIFFCPSVVEGFHNPPREAMAAGCCVVATNVGCIPDIGLHLINMLVVEPRDYDAMVCSIGSLISDFTLRTRLATQGRRDIENYDWDGITRRFLEIMKIEGGYT